MFLLLYPVRKDSDGCEQKWRHPVSFLNSSESFCDPPRSVSWPCRYGLQFILRLDSFPYKTGEKGPKTDKPWDWHICRTVSSVGSNCGPCVRRCSVEYSGPLFLYPCNERLLSTSIAGYTPDTSFWLHDGNLSRSESRWFLTVDYTRVHMCLRRITNGLQDSHGDVKGQNKHQINVVSWSNSVTRHPSSLYTLKTQFTILDHRKEVETEGKDIL